MRMRTSGGFGYWRSDLYPGQRERSFRIGDNDAERSGYAEALAAEQAALASGQRHWNAEAVRLAEQAHGISRDGDIILVVFPTDEYRDA